MYEPDSFCSIQALLDVQIRRRLIKHEDVGLLYADHGTREALQLPSRQVLHISAFDLQDEDILHKKMIHIFALLPNVKLL